MENNNSSWIPSMNVMRYIKTLRDELESSEVLCLTEQGPSAFISIGNLSYELQFKPEENLVDVYLVGNSSGFGYIPGDMRIATGEIGNNKKQSKLEASLMLYGLSELKKESDLEVAEEFGIRVPNYTRLH